MTWEDGSPVTPEQIAWGIQRSMDSDTFPAGPGTEYSQTYFEGAGYYRGPYTDTKANWNGVTVHGQDVTLHMARPFPDMDYWGAFEAMGAVPLGKASTPRTTASTSCPTALQGGVLPPNEELTLVRNDQWDPASDPARHQYVDKWVFKFNQDQAKVDQIMLSDNTESQTALATLGSNNYERPTPSSGTGWSSSPRSAPFLAPD